MTKLIRLTLLTLAVLTVSSRSALAVFPPSATFAEGLVVQPYSLQNSATTQEVCLNLYNPTMATIASVSVDSQMEEPATGVAGPWALLSSSPISPSIPATISVTCSAAGSVATIAATTSLGPLQATDGCCFVWQESPPGNLPDAGDLIRSTSAAGSVVTMELFETIPYSTTCGLVGLEFLIVPLSLRRLRRRNRT